MSMKIDKYVNRFLGMFWPEDEQGNRKAWFHSQNLNEDKKGNVKGFPWEGRWWLHYNHRTVHSFSWHLWSRFCGLGIKSDSEDGGLGIHAAFPPVSIWITLPIPLGEWIRKSPMMKRWNEKHGGYEGSHRYTTFEIFDVRVHDWALWWTFLKFDWGWSREMPKWMSGNFNIPDFVFGRQKYEAKEVEKKTVYIPMPEGKYEAVATKKEATRKRPRWFGKTETFVNLDIDIGIPHEGKGESDYNCGEDSLHGISGDNYEHAIARAVQSVLESRRKYDGNRDAVYPTPEERAKKIAELRAKNHNQDQGQAQA